MHNKYSINTSQNVTIDFEIAGIGERLIALIIDYLILAAIVIFFFFVASFFKLDQSGNLVFYVIVSMFLSLYHFILEFAFKGQSFGKKIQNIKVVAKNGQDAGFFQYLLRNVLRVVDLFYFIGVVVVFFTKKNQRLGDLAAGTIVIRFDKQAGFESIALSEIQKEYQPVYDRINVLRLNEQDIELIKEVIDRQGTEMNWSLVKISAEKVQKKTEIERKKENNLEFLQGIVNDFNYYMIN